MFATASWTLPGAVTPDAPNGIPTGVHTITPGLLEGIPSGVYTIVPPYECHVEAGPSEEKETFKLWFVSPVCFIAVRLHPLHELTFIVDI
jgi:hypothetical protein